MRVYHLRWAPIILLLAPRLVYGIPPPWTLEEAKAKADIILIARTGKTEPVQGVPGSTHAVSLTSLKVLKGDSKTGDEKGIQVLFNKPAEPAPGKDGVVAVAVGGTGDPKFAENDVQLLFLQKHRTDGRFTVVCGSFGQVKLDAASKQALDALKTRVGQFREWCQKITDEALRKAMDGYYQAALDFVAKPS